MGDCGRLAEKRLRLRPNSGGELGEGGTFVGRDEKDMKMRKEILPRRIARRRRKRRDRGDGVASQQSCSFERAGRHFRSDSYR